MGMGKQQRRRCRSGNVGIGLIFVGHMLQPIIFGGQDKRKEAKNLQIRWRCAAAAYLEDRCRSKRYGTLLSNLQHQLGSGVGLGDYIQKTDEAASGTVEHA